MTNYIPLLAAVIYLLNGTAPGAKAAETATAPAKGAPTRYVQAPSGSSLTFTFVQEGAASKGFFRKFTTELCYDEKSPAAGSLDVKVQTASVDTQDKDRNEMITGADLFDAQKFPAASYVAKTLVKRADGRLDAVGKLTLRGVTKDLRLPLKITRTATGVELSGETAIKRLDYGVGQGDWQSTAAVGDEVKLQYKVLLVKAP
jgi:polyisoprenoid-binding protein YceI